MSKEDVIRMAREAGYTIRQFDGVDEVMDGDNYHIQTDNVEKFAALVAAAEREQIIKLAEDLYYWDDSQRLIEAIRARSKT